MPPQLSSDQTLRAENAELRARLEEAEDMLRAIRAGEVDALVVEGGAGPQILTLQGADAEQSRARGEMLAQVSDAVVAVDLEQRLTFLNAAAERQYGVLAADVLGHALSELHEYCWLRPEDEAERMTALREHGEWHGENLQLTRDGRESHVESSVALLRGPDGAATGMIAAVRDITKRKEAEAALRRNAALFAEIIEQAPGGVYVVDAQFRVAHMNAESLPFFASVQPLIGRDFDEVLEIVWGPEIGPQCASIFRHTLATGERYVSPRFSEQRHDIGVEQAFEFETQRITLPDGQHGVVCYFQEVTARERAAAALRESEERLRLAIAGSDLGTWHWDIRTGALDWSERCLKIFGIPPRTAMSYEKFLGALHPEDRARTDDAVRRALQDGSEYRIEFRSVWPDGSVHWAVSLGRAYLDAAGEPTRMEGIALDITERQRAEAARRESERQYEALAIASAEVAYRLSADWSTLLPLDGRQLVASSGQPLADWAWLHQNIPPDEHPRVRQAISEAIARKTLFELEHRVWRPDGSIGWTFSRAVPILNENEDVTAWFGAASDITERKQAEQALADRTELLNGVLEGTTDVIFVKDLNGRLLLANAAFAAAARSTPEQLVGKTDEDWFPPDVAAAVRQQDETVIAGGSPIQFEETIPVAGEARSFLTLKAPLRDGSSRVVGILGIGRDITERKRAEAALRASEQFNQSVLNSIPAHVAVLDADGTVLAVNAPWRTFAEDNGLGSERCGPGTNYVEVCRAAAARGDADAAAVAQGVEAVLHGRQAAFRFEYACHSPDEQRWFVMEAQRALEPVTAAIVSHWSITERKQAEATLRENEERMRLATTATEVGIWEWNALTNALRWDAQMFRLYGVAPTADGFVSYETWSRTVLPEDLARLEEVLPDTLRGLGKSTHEFRILRADDGECRCIEAVETVRANEEGQAEWVVGTNLDITERKRTEEALRNNAAAFADLDRRKNAFLATLSHELRNPLGVIHSSLHLLRFTDQDRDAVQRGYARMQRQVVFLTRLIDDLMDVSRINEDKLTLRTERLDLATVVQSALENTRTVLDQRGRTVTVVLPPQPIEVDGDATRLAQVVSNLLTNAAKYSDPGSPIELTVERQGDVAEVAVRDRGIGIAPADLRRVFELFAQVGGARHLAQGGLGIGLHLVERVVELHGGSIEARSDGLGHGSEFLVRLPLASYEAPTERPQDDAILSPSPSRRYRILVADDNEDAVITLALLLSQLGHDVRTAKDGAQAVAVAATFQPEVALLDIGMPELDGHEACRLIRTQPGGNTMVLVAVSGWGRDEDKRRARDAGFQHHLVKPVDPVALTAVLQALAST